VGYTVIELDHGVLSFHIEGQINQSAWRRLIDFAVAFLDRQGGGSVLVPHPCADR
jgi:hypothetical protein